MLRKIWIVVGCTLAACGGSQRANKESEPAAARKPSAAEAPAPVAPMANEASCADFSDLDAAAKATSEIDGLPYWCYQYREGLHVLAICDGTPPEVRSQLATAWKGVLISLEVVNTPESKEAVHQACRTAVSTLCPTSVQAGCGALPPRR